MELCAPAVFWTLPDFSSDIAMPLDFHTPLNRPNHPSKVGYAEFFRIEFSEILAGSGNTM